MPIADKDRPDPARRRLLRRIGLAGVLVYSAPALTALGMAHASGASRVSRPSYGSVGSGRRRVQRAPSAPPPEMVMALPGGSSIAVAEAVGYRVLAARQSVGLGRGFFRLALPAGRSPAAARAELAALFPGAVVDENHLYTPDEFLCREGVCAAQEMIGWGALAGRFAPRIGMIDTGVNVDHEALAGQRLTVFQADLGERAAAGRQHGTAIAALLLGRGDSRTPGLLPQAELIAVEAFHRGGAGDQADAFALAGAVDLLLEREVEVINLSFSGPENAVLREVTEAAAARSVALVAAAGNGGAGAPPAYPAAWPHVLAVTAVDARGHPYRQAAQGPHIGLAAPGVGVWTAASVSGGRLKSGTSFAAPFVTAVLAVERLRAPEQPLEEMLAQVLDCARDLGAVGVDPVFGHGLVSAPGACGGVEAGVFPVSGE